MFLSDGDVLVTLADQSFALWDVDSGEQLASADIATGNIRMDRLLLSPDNRRLLVWEFYFYRVHLTVSYGILKTSTRLNLLVTFLRLPQLIGLRLVQIANG